MTWTPGDDVWVDIDGTTHAGEVVADDHGWVICRIHTDPAWDYGRASPHVMPIQTAAVRNKYVTRREPA